AGVVRRLRLPHGPLRPGLLRWVPRPEDVHASRADGPGEGRAARVAEGHPGAQPRRERGGRRRPGRRRRRVRRRREGVGPAGAGGRRGGARRRGPRVAFAGGLGDARAAAEPVGILHARLQRHAGRDRGLPARLVDQRCGPGDAGRRRRHAPARARPLRGGPPRRGLLPAAPRARARALRPHRQGRAPVQVHRPHRAHGLALAVPGVLRPRRRGAVRV
ncbi:unnamed protein product, partial [Prorocentrum cordatum]